MSYDTEIQKILLVKLITNACRTRIKSDRLQVDMSDDHITIPDRKWKDIIANEFSPRYTWESQTSKVVSKLVRHENLRDRNRWSNSLEIDASEAHNYFPKEWKP